MRKRVLSTIVLWVAVVLMVALFGIYGGLVLLAVLSGMAQRETYGLLQRTGGEPGVCEGLSAGTLFLILIVVFAECGRGVVSYLAALGLVLPALVFSLMARTPVHQLGRRLYPTLTGFLLVPGCLGFFAVLATLPQVPEGQALFLAVWVVAVAKFSDVGALLIGSRIGKRPLSPGYSPRKTVEGAVGGVFCSVVVACLLPLLFPALAPEGAGWLTYALIGLLLGVVAIGSDLLGSALKRSARIKDSGSGIPGIGGGLDLVDSLLLSGPVGCALFALVL